MIWLVIGLGVLAGLVYLGGGFRGADPVKLAAKLRFAGGVGGIGLAIVLALAGRWAVAVPVGLFGLSLLGYGRGLPSFPGRRPSRQAPQRSRVATAVLEVELDHASGAMNGRMIAGAYAGRTLDGLPVADLLRLRRTLAGDPESLSLLDAYLDRRQPGWREDVERDADAGQGGAAGSSAMSTKEAYETLGLQPGATDAEIRDAHRRLIKRVHPDAGGTAGLAAKINEAKERLLGGHRER